MDAVQAPNHAYHGLEPARRFAGFINIVIQVLKREKHKSGRRASSIIFVPALASCWISLITTRHTEVMVVEPWRPGVQLWPMMPCWWNTEEEPIWSSSKEPLAAYSLTACRSLHQQPAGATAESSLPVRRRQFVAAFAVEAINRSEMTAKWPLVVAQVVHGCCQVATSLNPESLGILNWLLLRQAPFVSRQT